MVRRLGSLFVLAAALVVVSPASAAYPGPIAVQGGAGLASADGSLHFIADAVASGTRIAAVGADGVSMQRNVSGAWGTVAITPNGEIGGLYQDGSAFVLQNLGINPVSSFLVVATKDLAIRTTIKLKGVFGFDALSPDGSRLYLIQHTSTQ